MKCPSCNTDLAMSQREGIEIDYCPACRGVWLDRGELDKIIERSAAYAGRDYDDDHDDRGDRREQYRRDDRPPPQHYPPPHYKKKKSFWSELFD